MALVGEAARGGGLGQARAAGDQPAGEVDPALDEIGVRRQASDDGETAQDLESAEAGDLRQVGQRERGRRLVVDQAAGPADRLGGGSREVAIVPLPLAVAALMSD